MSTVLIGNTEYSVTSPKFLSLHRKAVKTTKLEGEAGTELFSGRISGEDTNIKFKDLETGIKEYRQMKRIDPVIRGVLNAYKQPILRAKPSIIPASQDNEDLKIAEEIRSNLFENHNFTYGQWLKNILYYFDFGFEVQEKQFELVEGKWRWKAWQHRRPETIFAWKPDKDGNLESIEQQAFDFKGNLKTKIIIKQKSLFHIANEMEGLNWQGESVLRSAYRSFLSKDRLIRLQNVQAERGAVGVPHGIAKSSNPAKKKELIEALQKLRSHEESYLVSSEGDFELGFFGGKDFFGLDLKPYIEFHNNEIVEAINAGFLQQAKGDSAQGSRAKQEADIDFFALALESQSNFIEDTVNNGSFGMRHIPQLVDLNHKNVVKYPKYEIAKVTQDDVSAMMENLKSAKDSGVIDKFTNEDEEMARERLGWAEREMDDDEERGTQLLMPPKEEEEDPELVEA